MLRTNIVILFCSAMIVCSCTERSPKASSGGATISEPTLRLSGTHKESVQSAFSQLDTMKNALRLRKVTLAQVLQKCQELLQSADMQADSDALAGLLTFYGST